MRAISASAALLAVGSLALFGFSGCASPWYHREPYYCWVYVNTQMENGKPEGQYYIKTKIKDVNPKKLGCRHYSEDPRDHADGYWQIEGPFPPLGKRAQ